MRKLVFLTLLLALGAARARADEPARCFDKLERYHWDREKEFLSQPGERFLADLKACDPAVSAAVIEAVRGDIQTEEAQKFARHKTYVMAAYGVAWGILAVAALAMWLRQRALNEALARLEARVPK